MNTYYLQFSDFSVKCYGLPKYARITAKEVSEIFRPICYSEHAWREEQTGLVCIKDRNSIATGNILPSKEEVWLKLAAVPVRRADFYQTYEL